MLEYGNIMAFPLMTQWPMRYCRSKNRFYEVLAPKTFSVVRVYLTKKHMICKFVRVKKPSKFSFRAIRTFFLDAHKDA